MKLHLKILGITYLVIACLSGVAVVLFLIFSLTEDRRALPIIVIPAAFCWWCLQVGLGMLSHRRGVRLPAVILAVVLIGLNGIFLFDRSPKSAPDPVRAVLHILMMAVGIYTLVLMLHPRAKQVLK